VRAIEMTTGTVGMRLTARRMSWKLTIVTLLIVKFIARDQPLNRIDKMMVFVASSEEMNSEIPTMTTINLEIDEINRGSMNTERHLLDIKARIGEDTTRRELAIVDGVTTGILSETARKGNVEESIAETHIPNMINLQVTIDEVTKDVMMIVIDLSKTESLEGLDLIEDDMTSMDPSEEVPRKTKAATIVVINGKTVTAINIDASDLRETMSREWTARKIVKNRVESPITVIGVLTVSEEIMTSETTIILKTA